MHDIIICVLHSETFTKHKIISHGSQKLSFLTETEMACGNALIKYVGEGHTYSSYIDGW